MTPLDRLLLEAIPVRPAPALKPVAEPWTPEEQARHWHDLGEAIADWHWDEDPRHLRLVRRADTERPAA